MSEIVSLDGGGGLEQLVKSVAVTAIEFGWSLYVVLRSGVNLGVQVFLLTVEIGALAVPYVSPPVLWCIQEFSVLTLKAKLSVLSVLVVNSAVIVAWRRRWIRRLMDGLSSWHRRVADIFSHLGPYALASLLFYLPLKRTLSFTDFRVLFQNGTICVAVAFSLWTCLNVWRQSHYHSLVASAAELTTTPVREVREAPQSARPASAAAPRLATPASLSKSTEALLSDSAKERQVASWVFHLLTFWTLLGWAQFLLYGPEMLAESALGFRLPVFNLWSIASPAGSRRRLLLTRHAVTAEPAQFSTLKRGVFGSLVIVEELVMLCALVAAFIGDTRVAAAGRRSCVYLVEQLLHWSTGMKFELFPGSATGPSTSTMSSLMQRIAVCSSFLGLNRIADAGLAIAPIFLIVLLPNLLLKFVFLIVALLLPLIAAIKAMQRKAREKMAYWLSYFTGLALFLCTLHSPFGFPLRLRFLLVLALQFICTEPVWIAQQASRASVSALATARRHVSRPSVNQQKAYQPRPPSTPTPLFSS